MMDLLNRDTLKILLQEHQQPCVSIFMPTHRKGKEIEQDHIRFKNMLHRAEDILINRGLRSPEVRELLEPAEMLVTDSYFWREQEAGLAAFISPETFLYYRLPAAFDELLIISHRFHIKPLIPVFSQDGRFFILALSQKHPRLFHGSSYTLSEIDLTGIPKNIEEALKYDDQEEQLQFHTRTPDERGGRRAAVFHGHGVGTDATGHKKNILRYFQMIDKGVHNILRLENSPLITVGVDYLLPIYREANTYPHLMEEAMAGNAEGMNLDELHQHVWAIVQPYFHKAQQAALAQYRQFAHTGRASHDLDQIIKAAYQGRVDTLFINRVQQIWGIFDLKDNAVTRHQKMEPGDEDLLNLAAVQTILHQGAVYALDAEEMPEPTHAAAVFRY